ncbi:hypothetical protein DFH29DRAFT_995346 [Suillus ampliporus]|nr:hypothetical protein DFH29DRAFT_995346 [Suillus ampliporus]
MSPTRRNCCHAANHNQNRPLPPVPQPNFALANLLQAGPVPKPFAWQPPPNFPHQPLPVGQYPGLPQNAIAHVQHAHRLPPVDYNAHLNEQMNAAHNDRCRQHNIHQQQDRGEIRQQVQAELMAAGMQPPQQPHIPNEPIIPPPQQAIIPPAPPIYGPIHYEGAVGPHNIEDPLRYFAPNPIPPLSASPQPDYQQFNLQFQHHFQVEQIENEQIRNDLLHRQAQEAFHRQEIQQQEAEQNQQAIHQQEHDRDHQLDVQQAHQQAEQD